MKRLPIIVICLGIIIAISAGAVQWMKPSKASPAEVMKLISYLDAASESAKPPYAAGALPYYKESMDYHASTLQTWAAKCPRQEPLLDQLGGLVWDLKHSKESMTNAFTASYVLSPEDEAKRVAGMARERVERMRDIALASLASRK